MAALTRFPVIGPSHLIRQLLVGLEGGRINKASLYDMLDGIWIWTILLKTSIYSNRTVTTLIKLLHQCCDLHDDLSTYWSDLRIIWTNSTFSLLHMVHHFNLGCYCSELKVLYLLTVVCALAWSELLTKLWLIGLIIIHSTLCIKPWQL